MQLNVRLPEFNLSQPTHSLPLIGRMKRPLNIGELSSRKHVFFRGWVMSQATLQSSGVSKSSQTYHLPIKHNTETLEKEIIRKLLFIIITTNNKGETN